MEGYQSATYGERIAAVYDDRYGAPTAAQIDLLAELAGDGPILELGIGTGRVALPLVREGVRVYGLDASEAMVDALVSQPGGDGVTVTLSDFADFNLDVSFSLVYVVFNTFFCLPSQAAQVRCFQAVAHHLTTGGRFLVEAFVPDPTLFDRDQRVSSVRVELDELELNCTRHDPTTQTVTSQHVVISSTGIQLYPVVVRYAWPQELDLMAAMAGLRLEARWDGWDRRDYTGRSANTVSIWTPALSG